MKFVDFFLIIFVFLDPDPADKNQKNIHEPEGGTYLFLHRIQAASVCSAFSGLVLEKANLQLVN